MKNMNKILIKIAHVVIALAVIIGCMAVCGTDVQAAGKFNVKKSAMKKAMNGRSVKVVVNNKTQKFTVDSSEIEEFTVKSKKYSSKKTKMTVKAVAYIDRDVAVVKTNVKLVYKYKNKKWKISSVEIGKGYISGIKMKGKWSGSYVANQGKTKAAFKIEKNNKGVFTFSEHKTNPGVPTGSYKVNVKTDKKTGTVNIYAVEWISRPGTYEMIDFKGYVDLKNKKIKADWNLQIKKAK